MNKKDLLRVNSENYIVIQGWMIRELELKGNELIIYAIIYGFSQSENQVFSGSLQYLADWTNSTKQSVIKCLKSLVEKELVSKNENFINGVKFCEYYATKFNGVCNKVEHGMQQSLMGGIKQSLPNNIDNNNIDNNQERKTAKQQPKKNSFDEIIEVYTQDEEIRKLLHEWLKVRKAKRAAMTDAAIQMNIAKLDRLACQSNMTVKQYLEEVICRGWNAFYPIQQYGKKPTNEQKECSFDVSDLEKMMNSF